MERLLRINETAEALGVGRSKVYEWIAGNELRAVEIGLRGKRVPSSEIDRFIRERMSRSVEAA